MKNHWLSRMETPLRWQVQAYKHAKSLKGKSAVFYSDGTIVNPVPLRLLQGESAMYYEAAIMPKERVTIDGYWVLDRLWTVLDHEFLQPRKLLSCVNIYTLSQDMIRDILDTKNKPLKWKT